MKSEDPGIVCRVCREGWIILNGETHCLYCGEPAASFECESDSNAQQQGIFWHEGRLYVYPTLINPVEEVTLLVKNAGSLSLNSFIKDASWE